ncbi:pre-rRNA-processing protein TSR1 homolog [Scaptodrosophila lebanonensis]|uniref:Pre-rRNA-processing protein TSR1 homolog n=1 Tax=Drosophila lebanonensis TaxID=7225 RepID=A0A6J2TEG9_DROLE|nr:pre-rRNA-processing protein TSR1 homolog [Scaptodrosophila lebanonensis]
MADHTFHRPGPLKQTNKAHKTGKHRSKGAIENALKGKVSLKVVSRKHKQQQRKDQRRNQMNQLRKNKREEVWLEKRKLGGQNTAPFLVCLLPLHEQIDPRSALAILESCDSELLVENSPNGTVYINLPRFKQRFAFVIPPVGRGNELVVLDYLKVCDTTMLLTSAAFGEDEIFDRWGQRIFNMISAQGIPTPLVALMDLESINPKKRAAAKQAAQKILSKVLPEEKVMQLDTASEGLNVLRRIGGQKKRIIHNKDNRPHLLSDIVDYVPNADPNNELGTLKVTGFVRGQPLDINGLVHIPGLGDFQLGQIDAVPDPYMLDKRNCGEVRVMNRSDPEKQTSLQSEHIPDPMDAEQTWPTEEEIEASQNETKKMKLIKRVPKGYSEYQAAWIPEVEEVEEDEDDDDDDDDMGDDPANNDDDDFMSCDNKSFEDECEKRDSDTEEYLDSVSVASDAAINDDKYDQQMDFQEERETLQKLKEARTDQLWPDEIDTPLDVPAHERFQKYRGLESFRTSPWDAKENLPSDYARIYQFPNFDRTKRRILAEAKEFDGVVPGSYISLYVINVPKSSWTAFKSAHLADNVIVYGMLPHEHKMCVMNVILQRTPDSEVPLKSKEQLIVQCGYRRFVVNPIYSQHTNGDKHKFERYFRPYETVCATFYAPIQFPPAAVLAFKVNPDSTLALVARGRLLSCNPDRIVLKRVVLSGHPMRINRRSATIRYMFFYKDDVEYFKPVKLRTKCGRLGHIKESLGTHGHMKCYFDGQLRSYDTVFMYLYKRVFPKWTYEECLVRTAEHERQQKMGKRQEEAMAE